MGAAKKRTVAHALRDLFDDLSFAQVGAGALAAVTSMLLSSQIGIAGSVIGVAAGSVVSAVSSQVYKKFLAASAEKIKEIPVVAGAATALAGDHEAEEGETNAAGVTVAASAAGEATATGEHPADADAGGVAGEHAADLGRTAADRAVAPDDAAGVTSVTSVTPVTPAADKAALADGRVLVGESAGLGAAPSSASVARLSPEAVVAKARVSREARKRRRILAVTVASSLAAVLVTAGVVMLATQGEGLGTKPSSGLVPAREQVNRPADGVAAVESSSSQKSSASASSSDDASSSSSSSASSSASSSSGSSSAASSASTSSSASSSASSGSSNASVAPGVNAGEANSSALGEAQEPAASGMGSSASTTAE